MLKAYWILSAEALGLLAETGNSHQRRLFRWKHMNKFAFKQFQTWCELICNCVAGFPTEDVFLHPEAEMLYNLYCNQLLYDVAKRCCPKNDWLSDRIFDNLPHRNFRNQFFIVKFRCQEVLRPWQTKWLLGARVDGFGQCSQMKRWFVDQVKGDTPNQLVSLCTSQQAKFFDFSFKHI